MNGACALTHAYAHLACSPAALGISLALCMRSVATDMVEFGGDLFWLTRRHKVLGACVINNLAAFPAFTTYNLPPASAVCWRWLAGARVTRYRGVGTVMGIAWRGGERTGGNAGYVGRIATGGRCTAAPGGLKRRTLSASVALNAAIMAASGVAPTLSRENGLLRRVRQSKAAWRLLQHGIAARRVWKNM